MKIQKKIEKMNETRCRTCNRVVNGIAQCSCFKEKSQALLWDKWSRKSVKRKSRKLKGGINNEKEIN
jgi:hypothetical protein